MLLKLFILPFCFLIGCPVWAADLREASSSPQWLRLYQYRANGLSAITADKFFISPHGKNDAHAELLAAIDAFTSEAKVDQKSAACVFPARKMILEKLLNRKFPSPECAEFRAWKERLAADQASLVFVGAYPGNPASIFGHSFLRLSNAKREESGRDGIDLLSYSLGFLARSDPRDPHALYMLKGLTGYYPGYYEMEPHYMKVGIYNNAESRDLWEVKLKLTSQDVDLLTSHLWEVLFNAEMPYYFVDENCSQKLIKFIEAVRPDIDISRHLSLAVLPAETVRAAIEAGVAEPDPKFRASIKRKLQFKLARLAADERLLFDRARHSLEVTRHVENASVISALLDHWLFENYAASAKLADERAAIMDATYERAARVKIPNDAPDKTIRSHEALLPPFLGHRPKWFDLHAGASEHRETAGFQFRSGVHPFWSNDPGYRDVSAIEFLGVDLDWRKDADLRWKALLINARSLESAFGLDPKMSWSFEFSAGNECLLCENNNAKLQASGGVGGSWVNPRFLLFGLVHLKSAVWFEEGARALAAPGFAGGVKWDLDSTSLVLESSHHWWNHLRNSVVDGRVTYRFDTNRNIFFRTRYEDLGPRVTKSEFTLGWIQFFN